ncbi:MAG: hypothetical protein LBU55_01300 [Elusimicrobiota bacterium]|nr:hypothetical protein [Elusimicrobiota bacterium]
MRLNGLQEKVEFLQLNSLQEKVEFLRLNGLQEKVGFCKGKNPRTLFKRHPL